MSKDLYGYSSKGQKKIVAERHARLNALDKAKNSELSYFKKNHSDTKKALKEGNIKKY